MNLYPELQYMSSMRLQKVGLKEDTEYEVFLKGNSIGKVKTNLSGKLNLSIDLKTEDVDVKIVEA